MEQYAKGIVLEVESKLCSVMHMHMWYVVWYIHSKLYMLNGIVYVVVYCKWYMTLLIKWSF